MVPLLVYAPIRPSAPTFDCCMLVRLRTEVIDLVEVKFGRPHVATGVQHRPRQKNITIVDSLTAPAPSPPYLPPPGSRAPVV